jgi:hypothetical protein
MFGANPPRLWQFSVDTGDIRVRTTAGKLVGMAVDDRGQPSSSWSTPALIELELSSSGRDQDGRPLV